MPHAAFGPVQGPGGLVVFGSISFGDRCRQGLLTTVRGRRQERDELTKRSSYKMRLLVKLWADLAPGLAPWSLGSVSWWRQLFQDLPPQPPLCPVLLPSAVPENTQVGSTYFQETAWDIFFQGPLETKFCVLSRTLYFEPGTQFPTHSPVLQHSEDKEEARMGRI